MPNTRREIKAQEGVGFATTQHVPDGLHIVHAARSGNDVVSNPVPNDSLASTLRELAEVGSGGIHHPTVSLDKFVELHFESGNREAIRIGYFCVPERCSPVI